MEKQDVAAAVARLLSPFLEERGLELFDVEYTREGKNWFLRVFIDREGGVRVTDCEAVTEYLSPALDSLDLIPHRYYLEVSSPGIERPLRRPEHFLRFLGSQVVVKTRAPVEGRRHFEGILRDFVGDRVVLETPEGEVAIPYAAVSRARLKVF